MAFKQCAPGFAICQMPQPDFSNFVRLSDALCHVMVKHTRLIRVGIEFLKQESHCIDDRKEAAELKV